MSAGTGLEDIAIANKLSQVRIAQETILAGMQGHWCVRYPVPK